VELGDVVRKRRMTRGYSDEPVPPEVLDRVLGVALRGPSAGFSQGVDLLVLDGPAQTRQFFEITSDPEFLAGPGVLQGLVQAPVIVLPIGDPSAYVARYAEPDKARSSLAGLPAEDWPVPYWLVDSSFAVMLLLLAATDEGLGALFFRLHRDPGPLLGTLGVPEGRMVIGAVALGYEATSGSSGATGPAGSPGRRARRPMGEVVHRGRW
jgi:nitroreductase